MSRCEYRRYPPGVLEGLMSPSSCRYLTFDTVRSGYCDWRRFTTLPMVRYPASGMGSAYRSVAMRALRELVWKTMRNVPTWMVEPSFRLASFTMAPSTQVPLRLPRSLMDA